MAKINKKPIPDLSRIKNRAMFEDITEKFTAKDLFRTWRLARTTVWISAMWIFSGYTFYDISFGAQKLSGSIYLNMFLINLVELPGNLLTYVLSNKLGRKWTCVFCNILYGVSAFVVAVADVNVTDPTTKGHIINAFALTTRISNVAAWCSLATLTSETYPTVVRTIAYGFHATVGRIGSIIAPQIVYLSQFVPGLMYFFCGVTMIPSAVCAWLCEETRDKTLQDKFNQTVKDDDEPLQETVKT